jgi:transcriptional regulator with XRE-family HTH domain
MHKKGSPFDRWSGLHWQYQEPPDKSAINGTDAVSDIDVGGNLRRLREEQELSIRALAEKSGLAVNTLSLIENGKSSPSVSTLQQLALALNVPIIAFFEGEAPENVISYIKADRRPRAIFDHGRLEDLGAGTVIQAVEPFVVTLEPNGGSGLQEILHTGYEFVFCLEGRVAYTIAGHTYLLETGDSLLFEAHLPHRWQNLNTTDSRVLLVLVPTDERDYPTKQHFT